MVSIPRERGVTSSKSTSLTSPVNTAPWIAAPIATASSGLTPLFGAFPKNSLTLSWTFGILVCPPTKSTSSILSLVRPESFKQASSGFKDRVTRSETIPSSFALDICNYRCFGPFWSAERYARFTSVWVVEDNSIFAFSAASLILYRASLSLVISIPCWLLNSSTKKRWMWKSKSSPPSEVSPLVALTSNTPPEISRIEISKVPPPRS